MSVGLFDSTGGASGRLQPLLAVSVLRRPTGAWADLNGVRLGRRAVRSEHPLYGR